MVYYNENDLKTAAWLRELIKAGLIADGEVDTRSIVDVQPGDLRGFVQCHFFAGIGGWSYALRLAGWPDDRHVWTGSCPCQPWSMAGEGKGIDDPRHLWPAWFRLIAECRPAIILGEQTASLDGLYWFDLVYASLEASDYALGAADISGACLGSPDIRPRLWFVADTDRTEFPRFAHARPEPLHSGVRSDPGRLEHAERERAGRSAGSEGRAKRAPQGGGEVEGRWELQALDTGAVGGLGHADRERCDGEPVRLQPRRSQPPVSEVTRRSDAGGLADPEHPERWKVHVAGQDGQQWADGGRTEAHGELGTCREVRCVANANGSGLEERSIQRGMEQDALGTSAGQDAQRHGLLGGFWRDCEWIYCRPEPRYPEGCWRPIEPGSFPLVAGIPARILRLRGYGNSIKPHVAAEFISAYLEATA